MPECTLRAAVEEANANGQADTIGFAPALSGTITLALGQLLVANDTPTTADLSINGPGAGRIAVSGNGASRVFYVAGGANATIGGLTIKNGYSSEGSGGGIYNGFGSTLTLNNSTVSANQSSSYGGGIQSSNDLTGPSKTTITSSTISGNTAEHIGGGIFNHGGLTAIEHSTITDNTATPVGGFGTPLGSGVASYSDALTRTEVRSTIVSGNPGTDVDYFGNQTYNTFLSRGYNLVGDGNAVATAFAVAEVDQTGVADPGLSPLANNGGATQTHAVLAGSPAIDRGAPTGCPATDQRGVDRPQGGGCDTGSFELNLVAPKVSAATPTGTGIGRGTNVSATFSEKMDPASITKSTFKLFKVTSGGTTQVTNATVALSSGGLKATLNPFGTSSTLLAAGTRYKAVVTTGARDLAGNRLDQNSSTAGNQPRSWYFTTKG